MFLSLLCESKESVSWDIHEVKPIVTCRCWWVEPHVQPHK